MNTAERNLRKYLAVCAAVLVVGAAAVACAGADENSFLRTEVEVLGAEVSPLASARAAQEEEEKSSDRRGEFGWGLEEEDDAEQGPRNLGRKVRATLLSAVLPGAGQWYNGDRRKAYYMGAAEVGIWGAFIVFDQLGDSWKDSATDYAGIYAGTSGGHSDPYWINVGSYMDSDAYDESRRREARALQEAYPDPTSDADAWQWANNDRRQEFWRLWGDAHNSYDRRDYMYIFALVNRVVSMVDAAMGVDAVDGSLATDVLGMEMEVAVTPTTGPSSSGPGARWTFVRRF